MARRPQVRAKNGYWHSEAGGVSRYFGRIDEVDQAQATALLWAALAAGSTAKKGATPIAELRDRFLEWLKRHRSAKTHTERSLHLRRVAEYFEGRTVESITSQDVERFTAWLFGRGYATDYVHKHLTSMKHLLNRAVKLGWIAPMSPFSRVEPLRLPRKTLLEGDLPTREEVAALIEAGDAFGNMGDLLRLYHATGARTYELIQACVGDFQPRSRTIVLARHKRSTTMRDPVPRTIALNGQACEILSRTCEGRAAASPLFCRPTVDLPYLNTHVAERFQSVRRRAKVRDQITIYSLRHLWISEALMAGLDSLIVAKMAGTSVKMIETVYGHFRTTSFQDAQARLDAARSLRD